MLAALASVETRSIFPYLYLFLVASYALLYNRKKLNSAIPIYIIATLALIARIFQFQSPYDLIDISLWVLMLIGAVKISLADKGTAFEQKNVLPAEAYTTYQDIPKQTSKKKKKTSKKPPEPQD